MKRCETCTNAHPTDIDGLIDCDIDGHSKDDDMVRDKFADSEVKTLAEQAKDAREQGGVRNETIRSI